MKIQKITVRSKRTLPHPTKSFANYGADFELTAEIEDGDNEQECIEALRVRCENLCEQHCADVEYGLRHGETIRSQSRQLEQARKMVKELEEKLESHENEFPLFCKPS